MKSLISMYPTLNFLHIWIEEFIIEYMPTIPRKIVRKR